MKIAFILNEFPVLSETFILDQITGLLDRGHDVDIYAKPSGRDDLRHEVFEKYDLGRMTKYQTLLPKDPVTRLLKAVRLFLVHFRSSPGVLLRSLNFLKYGWSAVSLKLLYRVIPFLGSEDYDIVHCHFGPNGNVGVMLRDIGAVKGKLITTFYGYDAGMYPLKYGRDVYDRLFASGDHYVCISNYIKDKITDLGCPCDKIDKIPLGIDPSKYIFREKYNDRGAEARFLTVARLEEKKGLEYSIKAVARVMEKYPNIRYDIAGGGTLEGRLKSLIDTLGMSGKINLLGWRTNEQVKKLYEDADIFILASVTASNGDQEGQGLVLQEAQAIGIPVLSTLHNGIPEGVVDGQTGFLVPEKDVDALVDKIENFIENTDLWKSMGVQGRRFVETEFDIDKINDDLVSLYGRVTDA